MSDEQVLCLSHDPIFYANLPPMANQEPRKPSKTDLTYNSYLKVPEILELQKLQSNPPHHDELLFIVIHQAYELWFKLVLHEMESAIESMGDGRVLRARHFVARVVEIMRVLIQQIHILETMKPAEFLGFRDRLMPASGFQSSQFREVEYLAGLRDKRYLKFFDNQPQTKAKLEARLSQRSLRDAFYQMLSRKGLEVPENALEAIESGDEKVRGKVLEVLANFYSDPEQEHPMFVLMESLVDFDQGLALWREHHVRVVERVIGFKRGTGGSSGVSYLKTTLDKKAFPLLWEVRSML